MVTEFHHLGINVSDIDTSISFYEDILDMELDRRFAASDAQATLNGLAVMETAAEIAFLHGNGCQLELVEYDYPESENINRGVENHHIGRSHICFEVSDCVDNYHALKSDVQFLSEPQIASTSDTTIVKCVDPDGHIVEFIEFPETNSS